MAAGILIRSAVCALSLAPLFCFAQSPSSSTLGTESSKKPRSSSIGASAIQASTVHCDVAARLVEATHGRSGKKGSGDSEETEEEKEQLKTLPYGSFQTLSAQRATLLLGQPGSLELPQRDGDKFLVKVTPHSFADNKVHYTVEWTTPKEKSVVATRLGVENGRNIMLGTDTLDGPKKRCLVVGIKVNCQKEGEKAEVKAEQ